MYQCMVYASELNKLSNILFYFIFRIIMLFTAREAVKVIGTIDHMSY